MSLVFDMDSLNTENSDEAKTNLPKSKESLVKYVSNEKKVLREIVQLKEIHAIRRILYFILELCVYSVTYLINALPGNGSINTFQRATMETVSHWRML
jgi:hypothetical protein